MTKAYFFRTVAALSLLVLLSSTQVGAGSAAEDGRVRGRADAPITLIEYSDFTCGWCVKFFQATWPRLQAKYIDTGKVRFLYRDYPRADQGVGVEAAANPGSVSIKYSAFTIFGNKAALAFTL